MKILFLVPSLFADDGGIPRILRLYTKALCEMPGRVQKLRIVSLNDDAMPAAELARYSGAALEFARGHGHRKLGFIRDALKAARGCDHILCGHVTLLPVAALAAKLCGIRSIDFVAHGVEVWRWPTLAEKLSLPRVRSALCVSAFTRNRMREFLPLRPEQTQVIHNGLDAFFEIADQAPPRPPQPVILCVSRLCKADSYKGVDILIEAMSTVWASCPEARLRIVGQGDDLMRLRRLAVTCPKPDNVTFTGHVDDRQLTREFEGCQVFALPSGGEGFGLVFLEAMARGRPCVGAAAGGVPEVVTPESGLLVPFGDRPALGASLVEALGRHWNEQAILARAKEFSYTRFLTALSAALPEGQRP